MAPGSLPWLVHHDLRIAWRDARAGFGRLGPVAFAALGAVALAITHVAAWDIAGRVGKLASGLATRAEAEAYALPFAAFILLLLLAQTLNGATKLLYARGDLDLLLSSPTSPRRLLAARGLAVAFGAFASAAVFALPIADAAAARGHLRLFALYPTLGAAAVLAAAIGLAIALGLFRVLGARRTRLVAQLLATLIGAGFIIGLQVRRVLPDVAPGTLLPHGGWPRSALLLPVRAALGDVGALLLWLALAAIAFAAVALLLGPAFGRSAEAAAGAPTSRPRPRHRAGGRSLAQGSLAEIRSKERRLIARDPWLASQMLLQALYMTPLAALLWSGSGDPALALAPSIVVVTFQLSSSLAWLGLSGEDAPDLLASAPVPASMLRRGKREAVAGLTLAVVGFPLLYLATISLPVAVLVLGLAAVALMVAVAVQGWHAAPGRRSAFAVRHRESKLMGLVELTFSVLFGVSAALASVPSVWSLAPLALVGALVFWLRPSVESRGASA